MRHLIIRPGKLIRPFLASLLFGAVAVGFFSLSPVLAADPEELFRGGPSVRVGADEAIQHDLFMAGDSINIDGSVLGDVVAVGERVVVDGTVAGDLWIAARSIRINGTVAGDVRALGQDLIVEGGVEGNVQVAAQNVAVGPGATVGGDLLVGSESLDIKGTVQGDVSGTTTEYLRAGTVGGVDRVSVETPAGSKTSSLGDWMLGRARHWLSLLLVGALFGLLGRKWVLGLSATARQRPLASLGAGLVVLAAGLATFIGILVFIGVTAVVLGPLGLGGLTAVAVVAGLLAEAGLVLTIVAGAIFLAGVVVALVVGRSALEGRWRGGRLDYWAWLALGALGYVVIAGLPYAGAVVQWGAALAVWGVVGLGVRSHWERRGAMAPVEEPI